MANDGVTWRLRWRAWRGRWSAPGLLARCDEARAISWLAAVHAGLGIGVISVGAWLTELPLLFPALGPSSFILFTTPLAATAAPRNVVGGHWICLGVGLVVWRALGWWMGGAEHVEGWVLYAGAAVALALACWMMVRLEVRHPPACASALVVVLGGVSGEEEVLVMGAAVTWLALQAVVFNRLAGLPMPLWRPRESS